MYVCDSILYSTDDSTSRGQRGRFLQQPWARQAEEAKEKGLYDAAPRYDRGVEMCWRSI